MSKSFDEEKDKGHSSVARNALIRESDHCFRQTDRIVEIRLDLSSRIYS